MTGKQFKEFANRVPDEAIVEVLNDSSAYKDEWNPIDPKRIKAKLFVLPSIEQPEHEAAQA